MLNRLKGSLSANLLAARSNHTVSRASLYAALFLAVLIAFFSVVFAIAQWRVGETLAALHEDRTSTIEERIGTSADMATQQANAHRATLNVLLSRDASEFAEAENQRRSNLEDYLASAQSLGHFSRLQVAAEDLRSLAMKYGEISARVVDLQRQGQRDAALNLRVNRLREAFNEWQSANEAFSKKIAQDDLKQQKDYESATMIARRWLLALLIAPLAVIALGLVAMVAVLSVQRVSGKSTDIWTR